MSKCGSYALLFALSLIGFSIGFSGSANAATLPSENIAQSLLLGGNLTAGGCFSQSISLHEDEGYNDIFTDDSKHYHYSKAWKPSGSNARVTEFADKWVSVQDDDDMDWAVVQVGHGTLRFFIFNKDAEFRVGENGIYIEENRTISEFEIFFNESVGCRLQVRDPSIDVTALSNWPLVGWWQGDPSDIEKIFVLRSDNIYYDEDYTGTDIPTAPGGSGADSRQTIRPDFKYTIVDKELSLSDHNQALPEFVPEEGYNMVEYLVEWTVTKCEGHDPEEDFEQQGLCTGSEYVTSERLPQSDTFEYEVAEYGNYQLRAQYLIHQCHRYPSYPTTPDYCFYVEVGTQYEAYDWGETTKNVTIDGRTIIGDTDLESCDEFNICTRPSQDSVISNYFQDKNASGLMMFLQAPIVFYQSLPAMTQSCTPITVPFLGGRTFELECLRPRYQQLSPFIYTMFQTVINGVVAYAVATKIFARIKNVNDPENDRIEVARL